VYKKINKNELIHISQYIIKDNILSILYTMEYFLYKDYLLNNIHNSKGIFVDENKKNIYKDFYYYTQYDQNNIEKKKYLVAFLVETLHGIILIPTYNFKLGNLKNELHKELHSKFQKLQVYNVYNLGLPYDISEIIETYL